jgi:hypothetical protein
MTLGSLEPVLVILPENSERRRDVHAVPQAGALTRRGPKKFPSEAGSSFRLGLAPTAAGGNSIIFACVV